MKTKQIESGEVFPTNEGGSVTVVKYRNSGEVIIQHNDAYGHVVTVGANHLRKGQIRNPYHPSVRDVGFIGIGEHAATIGGKRTPAYDVWNSMIKRCYCPKNHANQPTYKDCTVHPNWHNYQNFAAWFEKQYRAEGWQLDKDLIVEGNKVYSTDTCTFVPHQINSLLENCGATRGDLPQGVSRHGKRYRAHLRADGKTHQLGAYATPEEAFIHYKLAKEANVKRMAEQYKCLIDPRVYDSLMRYEVSK